MSFLTGTNVELIASSATPGTALSNSTSQTVVSPGNGNAYLPIGFFYTNAIGKKLRVVSDGWLSTTATPTMKLGVSLDTTMGTVNTSQVSNFLTGAVSTATAGGAAQAQWHMEFELCVNGTTQGLGSAQTVNIQGLGWVAMAATGFDATAIAQVFLGGTTTVVAYPINQAYFVEVVATWGTSSASNTLTCSNISVYGCN